MSLAFHPLPHSPALITWAEAHGIFTADEFVRRCPYPDWIARFLQTTETPTVVRSMAIDLVRLCVPAYTATFPGLRLEPYLTAISEFSGLSSLPLELVTLERAVLRSVLHPVPPLPGYGESRRALGSFLPVALEHLGHRIPDLEELVQVTIPVLQSVPNGDTIAVLEAVSGTLRRHVVPHIPSSDVEL